MDGEKRKALDERRVEQELKQGKDALYIRVLLSFGVISILIGAVMLLMYEYEMIGQSVAMFVIGIFLLVTGLVWQHKDTKQLEDTREEIQRYRDEELSIARSR